MSDRYVPDNFNDAARSYVVGILSPSTTLYIDRPDSNRRSASPPDELALRRRNTNSFQITSVTVQGSRSKADDLGDGDSDMEDHTDDLSSDFLDSSRCDNDCYNSPEDCTINSLCEDLSPPGNCGGPIVFPNVNLGGHHQGVTPTFASVGPVASGGVTVMTSKSESPVSAQVPVMNPLPENWQRRFRVVKIVSSEPFRRGRWTCMDFKDPPSVHPEVRPELGRLNSHPPTIQVTNYDAEIMLPSGHEPHLCGLPIEQTYNGNFVMSNQQQMYGIILPQNDQVPPVALVQDMSIQTTVDRNSNHIMDQQNAMYQQNSLVNSMPYSPCSSVRQPVTVISSGFVPGKTYSQSANGVGSNQHAVNCPALSSVNINSSSRHRTNSGSNIDRMNARNKMDTDNTESSQTAPEKIPSSAEVGRDVEPPAGSAASAGSNTVAIDNKIEQAMDLVKSHLMFAVREEVEVLKEKISELLERISQLEHENDILRANASAETLKQLNNQSHKKILSGQSVKPQPAPPQPSTT